MATDTVDLTTLIAWLDTFRGYVTENRAYLTELDSAIGDADHGINMTRGMDAVFAKLTEVQAGDTPFGTIDDLFKAVGMTLVTSVGGASGPLYGTFFLRMGRAAGTAVSLDAAGLGAALRAGLEGVVARGKPEAGDKTMYDAMSPALDAYDAAVAGGAGAAAAAQAAFEAAEVGRDATIPWVARKGRASYLGERSAGHLDPGATSTALLFRSLAETLA
ncbi:MAG TPA: dihydroxyacetone kinase subunit DhaL [Cellulomonas sp.]